MAGKTSNVVVVTGASSGLGRAASVQFAARGCTVVVAARRRDALEETARRCRTAGGNAVVAVTDVTRQADVARLADVALGVAGRIDVWVNNAGVTLFARLEDAPMDEVRRVIETNLYGAIYGARAVMPIFRRQHRGVLINVGSVLSKIGHPFVPAYSISKFALHGLTESLRTEVADQPDVHVCSLLPYAIDTPHFESGANRLGRPAYAMPPVMSPEDVARALVALAERPRRERYVPRIAVLGLAWHALMPRTTERLILQILRAWHFADRPQPETRGNLDAPDRRTAAVHGTRPPQIDTVGLIGWVVRNLIDVLGGRRTERAARVWDHAKPARQP